jgi:hypothetical protein
MITLLFNFLQFNCVETYVYCAFNFFTQIGRFIIFISKLFYGLWKLKLQIIDS